MTKRKPLTPPPPFDNDEGTIPGGAYEHSALVARSLQDDEWKEFALDALHALCALAAEGLRYRAQLRERTAAAGRGKRRAQSLSDPWSEHPTVAAFRRRQPPDQDSEDWLAENVEAWAAALMRQRREQDAAPDKASRKKLVRRWLKRAGELPPL